MFNADRGYKTKKKKKKNPRLYCDTDPAGVSHALVPFDLMTYVRAFNA